MILCCGEALIDMVPVDANGTTAFVPLPGGAVFNTAIALGRLEAPVGFYSGLSTDMFGNQLAQSLQDAGVDTAAVKHSARPTTLAFVKITDGQATYSFYDENTAGRMLGPDDLPRIGTEVSTLYFGGISLCAEPAAQSYEALALRSAADAVIMIDPNIRTGFIEDASAYRARLKRMIAVADVVKVSDEDLDWIVAGDMPLDQKVAQLRDWGAGIVVVTRGAQGAVAYLTKGAPVHVPAAQVTIVDTVGAGDTFNAGLLARLQSRGVLSKTALRQLDRETAADALAFAAQVAGVTVSRQGATPPMLDEVPAI